MIPDSDQWFTEIHTRDGSAFSLRLGEHLHGEQTPYQRIDIYQTETFGRLMVIDGCTMLSTRDNFIYHEMMSHPVLYTHPAPAQVLIIGGGDCGTLREVLRHESVDQVVQVDIDERVTRLAEEHFPELTEGNGDPRATLLFEDGIDYLRRAAADSFDVIIVDSTDPVGPAEGLFQAPFFRDCRRVLRASGILVQQSESPLYHLELLRAMRRAMADAGFDRQSTLQFPQCIYPSGWWSATMAGSAMDLTGFRKSDARSKPFDTRFYSADMHRAALTLPPFVKHALAGESE